MAMEEPSVQQLLEQYAQKPIQRFLQVDAHDTSKVERGYLVPDRDGDCLTACLSYDLRASGEWLPVRVQIVPGADREQVLRMLQKIQGWLAEEYEALVGTGEPGYYWGRT